MKQRRIVSLVLSVIMVLSLVPAMTSAAEAGGIADQGIREISKKAYAVAPDVTEYEWLLNNDTLTAQMVTHVMEVKMGEDSTASLATGYSDYNIEAIKGGQWAMKKTTEQAQAMENNRDVNVVGAVNGGGYDMSNGRPSGALVLNGTFIQGATGTTFWVDKAGAAHITDGTTFNEAREADNVLEAISSFGDIVINGDVIPGLDDATRASRTAVGIKENGDVVIFMVDGRQAPYSVGMTMADLASAMVELGCEIAVNLDGGGSSTFATQREGDEDNDTAGLTLRCRPSDGYERTVSNSLMVLSYAESDGSFDHAVITPNDDVYTPGSTVEFSAIGVDGAGNPADLPADAVWEVAEGEGTITADGVFTAGDVEEQVTIALTSGGETVGTTTVEIRWPDVLGFSNNSVSLDFGETSDMTFNPTWNGRVVNYKDGDFEWELVPTYYKFNALVDPISNNGKGNFAMPITPETLDKDTVVVEYYAWGTSLTYTSTYRVTSLEQTADSDGTEYITAIVKYVSSGGGAGEKIPAVDPQTFTQAIGQLVNNTFVADEISSLRGVVNVSLKDNDAINGSVDVVVGMEPYVLMDFEDHTNPDGTVIDAEEYWKRHLDSSSTGSDSNLTSAEVKATRLWFRDTTNKGVIFPDTTGIVSAEEDKNVRFGEYAMRLDYDFTDINITTVASGDFGFSGDLLVNTVQPTRIGLWLNVPEVCEDDNSVLKAVLKGGAKEADLATSYMTLNEDGTMTYTDGKQLNGTAAYVQYYSYDADGNITGEKLSDWAGKGWIWVEADISAYQMPLDVCRAYTVRITSPQNCTKSAGYIYIDNLQFIYGTNTNDINNPVIEAVTETGSGAVLSVGETAELPSGTLNFSVAYGDSELEDKYATGVDESTIRISIDDDEIEISEMADGILYLTDLQLRNGLHTMTVTLKDFYGNETSQTYYMNVSDPEGLPAAISVLPQLSAPIIDNYFNLYIVNKIGETINNAQLTIELPEAYLTKEPTWESSDPSKYEVECRVEDGKIIVDIAKPQVALFGDFTEEDYVYDHQIACLGIYVPADSASDATLKYTVTQGKYTTEDANGENLRNYTFAGKQYSAALDSDYQLTFDQAIVGYPTTFTVVDADGNPVPATIYSDGVAIGSANIMTGKLTYTYTTSGPTTVYAKDNNGRSYDVKFAVSIQTVVNEGMPYGIQNNGVTNPTTEQSITWITSIGFSEGAAVVKYALTQDMADALTATGTSQMQTFPETIEFSDAVRSNCVRLTGLTPGTTYYYQVGDGTEGGWSEVCTFTTAAEEQETTRFFILGDIQTGDTTNLVAAVRQLAEGTYDFGVQTGDAIDGVNKFSEWRGFFPVINSTTLKGVDLIHALGNHEYYGDLDGVVSGRLFDLPESEQNSWYKMEYGNVCVVVVNNGNDLAGAAADIAENLETDCTWKILVTHEPIYGTTDVMSAEKLSAITSALEEAGIDFVFGGDDHAYARTYPMIGNVAQAENSREGVVYYISGDLSSKSNAFTKQEAHAEAIPHVEYGGLYITAEATDESITINAYKYDGTIQDTYTETRTNCELGNHEFNETSKYNMADGTISCVVCQEWVDADAVSNAYTGLLATADEKKVILVAGVPATNQFTAMGDLMYHSCADGYANDVTVNDPTTCTRGGRITYVCKVCEQSERAKSYTMPNGHTWDENHVCTVCKTKGIDISDPSLVTIGFGTIGDPVTTVMPMYNFKSTGVRPVIYATSDGKTEMTMSSDATLNDDGTMRDLFISRVAHTKVGYSTINFTGKGDYYGEFTLTFKIVPVTITNLKASKTTMSTVTLSWAAAPGAESYRVYSCDAKGNHAELIKTVKGTSFKIEGLEPASTTYYKVRSIATVDDNKVFESARWSNILAVTTELTDPVDTLIDDVILSSDTFTSQLIQNDDGNYLIVPGNVDVAEIEIQVSGSQDIVVSGDRSEITLKSAGGYKSAFDLSSIATVTDGKATLQLKIGTYTAMDITVYCTNELPELYIVSDNEEEGREFVDASKSNVTTGSVTMISENGTVTYEGALSQIKARGNSTFVHYDKKSYQIKLDPKGDLLGINEDVKTWVLLAGYADATMMHDKVTKDLADAMGLAYVASCDWVNLYYDGEYRGVYLLSEKNSIGSTSVDITDLEGKYEELNPGYGESMSLNVAKNAYDQEFQFTLGLTEPDDITGGYLIELNHSEWDEASGFDTKQGVSFNVKSPEWCGEDAMTYISEYYQEFEDAVFATDANGNYTGINPTTGKHYSEYVDKDSLVKTYVLRQFNCNPDGFASSMFFYKDAGDIMYCGPVWDQEIAYGSGWNIRNDSDTDSGRYLEIALIEIPDFKEAVIEYYNNTAVDLFKELTEAGGTIDQHYNRLDESAAMNYLMWPYVSIGNVESSDHLWADGTDYETVVDDMKDWIDGRMMYLDKKWGTGAESYVLGDVNGNGIVDNDDYGYVLRYLFNYEDNVKIEQADVDRNGVVDNDDYGYILRYMFGYDDNLGIGKLTRK